MRHRSRRVSPPPAALLLLAIPRRVFLAGTPWRGRRSLGRGADPSAGARTPSPGGAPRRLLGSGHGWILEPSPGAWTSIALFPPADRGRAMKDQGRPDGESGGGVVPGQAENEEEDAHDHEGAPTRSLHRGGHGSSAPLARQSSRRQLVMSPSWSRSLEGPLADRDGPPSRKEGVSVPPGRRVGVRTRGPGRTAGTSGLARRRSEIPQPLVIRRLRDDSGGSPADVSRETWRPPRFLPRVLLTVSQQVSVGSWCFH